MLQSCHRQHRPRPRLEGFQLGLEFTPREHSEMEELPEVPHHSLWRLLGLMLQGQTQVKGSLFTCPLHEIW